MAKSPMLEIAAEVLEEAGKQLTFHDLWEKVISKMDIDKKAATKRIARLYSDMTLDKRFVSLPKNQWDLKKRLKLEDTIVDTSDIIVEDEEFEDDDIDIEEENEDIDDTIEDDQEIEIFEDDLIEDDEFEDEMLEFEELASTSEN